MKRQKGLLERSRALFHSFAYCEYRDYCAIDRENTVNSRLASRNNCEGYLGEKG